MFDVDISFSMLHVCNSNIKYFDCRDVSVEFLCIHTDL